MQLIVDLGQWWHERTGLPLPLGANAIRKDLGTETIRDVNRLLKESIEYGLEHREEALDYALQLRPRSGCAARPTSSSACTSTTGRSTSAPRGREAVAEFLAQGHAAGVLPEIGRAGVREMTVEFVTEVTELRRR